MADPSASTPASSPPPPSTSSPGSPPKTYSLPARQDFDFVDQEWNPCLKSDIRFRNLPTEIILRILSYLSPHDLVQSASCCREWYHIASDPHLWRELDLSALRSSSFNPKTATALTSRLRTCRSFTLREPENLTQPHITALLHFLSSSKMLSTLQLTSLNHLLNPHSLEHHFRLSQSQYLAHVDLNHSNVTTPAVVAMMEKHKNTLQTLDLSNTAIGDGTLRAIASAKQLHTLNISNCPGISRTSIRNFLTKRFPPCLRTLSLCNLKEVKVTWLYDLLRLPSSQNLAVLNLEGCERLTQCEIQGLMEFSEERKIKITHNAKPLPADDIWGYRRYIEFLGAEPTLEERLAAQDKAKKEAEKAVQGSGKENMKAAEAKVAGAEASISSGSRSLPRRSQCPTPPREAIPSVSGVSHGVPRR